MASGVRSIAFLSTVLVWCACQQLLVPTGAVLLEKGNVVAERQPPQHFLKPTLDAFLEDGSFSGRRQKHSTDVIPAGPTGAPLQATPPIMAAPSQVTPPTIAPYQATAAPTTLGDVATGWSPQTIGAPPAMDSQLPFDSIAYATAVTAAAGLPTVGITPQASPPSDVSKAGQQVFDGAYKNQSDTVEGLTNQAEVIRQRRQMDEQLVASLQAQVDDAEGELSTAKEKEAAANKKVRAAKDARTDQEIRVAISTERWNHQMSQLDDKLTAISEQAKQEQEDRIAEEALVKAAEAQKAEQALQAAKVLRDDQTAQAYQNGANAQQEFDQTIFDNIRQALKDISKSVAKKADVKSLMDDLAAKGDKSDHAATPPGWPADHNVKPYQSGTTFADAISTAFADATRSADAAKAKEIAVDIKALKR